MEQTKIDIRKTITTIFMVPTIKIKKEDLKENNFLNGYIKDATHDVVYEDSVCLLFKPSQIDRFREFLDGEYESTRQVIDDWDYPNGFVVVVYKLNIQWKDDFKLIKQGKYSRTSPEFQKQFPRVVKLMKNGLHRDEISLQYRIFNKTEELVKFWEEKFDVTFDATQELWRSFELEDETLTEQKLIEYGNMENS